MKYKGNITHFVELTWGGNIIYFAGGIAGILKSSHLHQCLVGLTSLGSDTTEGFPDESEAS